MKCKKTLKNIVVGSLAVLTLAVFAGGCGSNSSSDTVKKDTLVVGTNATFMPFEFKSDATNDYDGFDIDLVKALGKHMNKSVEMKNIAFDALIPALKTKDIDLAASGMTITKARTEAVNFSAPYAQSALAIVFKEGSNIQSVEDLVGKTISVQMGSTGADEADKVAGASVKKFDHASDALLDLYNDGVQATIVDMAVAQFYKTQHPDAHIAYITYPSKDVGYLGLAIAKDNTALKNEVNTALKEMKENGELDQIYQKWFGENAPELPETVTF